MLPKASTAEQIDELVRITGPDVAVIALIETAAGVLGSARTCAASGVVRAAFGSVDLGAELGIDPTDTEALRWARSTIVIASAAAGLAAPLDGVTTNFADEAVLGADADEAMRMGFGGKLCIHPGQVGIINAKFTPSPEQITHAREVIAASREGAAAALDGQMIDAPVVRRAKHLLQRADSLAQGIRGTA
jgi:citrate lyase subunit beta/citryl-CoA lyase